MGVMTDQPPVPYQPPQPKPGIPPSGIGNDRNIRGLVEQAKNAVSNRQQNFLAMVRANTPQSESGAQKYASAAADLFVNQPLVDKFVDWVLFG